MQSNQNEVHVHFTSNTVGAFFSSTDSISHTHSIFLDRAPTGVRIQLAGEAVVLVSLLARLLLQGGCDRKEWTVSVWMDRVGAGMRGSG